VSSTLALLRAVDTLYESVVTDPEAWHEQAFADWAADVAADGLSREQARGVRRVLRIAHKLRDFWGGDEAAVAAEDWRTRVDIALGPRAWRPTLEMAQAGLDAEPSAQLFAEVRNRFRVVNSERWMDGVDYQGWLDTRPQ
jgi:hypothetical protein